MSLGCYEIQYYLYVDIFGMKRLKIIFSLAVFFLLFLSIIYQYTPLSINIDFISCGIIACSSDNIKNFKICKNYDIVKDNFEFDINGDDVIVFLHIQKTGGTSFGRNLVRNLKLETPCKCITGRKSCTCVNKFNKTWLLSRYSTGWVCGLHADWTDLKHCVDGELDRIDGSTRNRRYHYITILREPMLRFLSEWKHVARGATWKSARLSCNGQEASLQDLPFCHDEPNWSEVKLSQFMSCPYNLAVNRQTRMLANLSLVDCYPAAVSRNLSIQHILLESACGNLFNMPFFGLIEYQRETQLLFENTFGLKFQKDFVQINITKAKKSRINPNDLLQIAKINSADMQLYQYAKNLFLRRAQAINLSIKL